MRFEDLRAKTPPKILEEIEKLEDESDQQIELYVYDESIKQIDLANKITFGNDISVLLLSDRLPGCAAGLEEFLAYSTDISVQRVNNFEDAKKIITEMPIDFLIIVGYLENLRNYDVIELYRSLNRFHNVVFFAILSDHIKYLSVQYNITLKFDRWAPLEDFLLFLQTVYKNTETSVKRGLFDEAKAEWGKLHPPKMSNFFKKILGR